MNNEKLYYFTLHGHHYFISRIDKESYGIFDLSTMRYTDERWDTLDEAIDGCKKYYLELDERNIFSSYKDLFQEMLNNEEDFKVLNKNDSGQIDRIKLYEDR